MSRGSRNRITIRNMIATTTLTTIIFDYGGTLDTNARHWAHVLWEGYRHARIPVSEEAFREAYVFGERALARQPIILPDDDFHALLKKKVELETDCLLQQGAWNPSSDERAEAVALIASYCDDYVRRNLEDTRRVLNALRERYALVLVSNFYGNLHAVLRGYGLQDYFPVVIESAVVGVRKPDPAIYRLGVEAAGVPVEQVLVVGDSFRKDIVPAKSVGCSAVWMKGEGWKPETEDESLPDAIITDLRQLPALLGI